MRAQSRPTIPLRSVLLVAGIALLAAWTIASGYYIAFHDRLLASLLGRQAQMQYAYEDRIAALQASLDGMGLRTDREDDAHASRWRDLEARSLRLEASATRIEAMLAAGKLSAGGAASRSASDGIRRVDGADTLDTKLTLLERRQSQAVRGWSERTRLATGRVQSALAVLGLAESDERVAATGGPFIPLPDAASTIETEIDVLRTDLARRDRLEAAAARLPLRTPVEGRLDVTSGFGARRDPFLGRLALHSGIDLREDYGSPVDAVAGGTVASAGPEAGYGTMVEIDHGNGYTTRYAHLSSATVIVGQRVGAGDRVGTVGTSGRSTGPHLHYEIRIAGQPIDPARYLELAATIAGR